MLSIMTTEAVYQEVAPYLLADLLTLLGAKFTTKSTAQDYIEAAHEKIDRIRYNQLVSYASIEKWGERAQANQTTEECAELIVALNKFYNRDYNGTDAAGVITEVADVEIMCACMRIVLGSDLVEAEKNRKLERLGTQRLGMASYFDVFDKEPNAQTV